MDQGYFFPKEYKQDCRKSGCEMCGISRNMQFKLFGMNLHLHHDKGNYDCHPDELKTLCSSCHPKRHWDLKRIKNEDKISRNKNANRYL